MAACSPGNGGGAVRDTFARGFTTGIRARSRASSDRNCTTCARDISVCRCRSSSSAMVSCTSAASASSPARRRAASSAERRRVRSAASSRRRASMARRFCNRRSSARRRSATSSAARSARMRRACSIASAHATRVGFGPRPHRLHARVPLRRGVSLGFVAEPVAFAPGPRRDAARPASAGLPCAHRSASRRAAGPSRACPWPRPRPRPAVRRRQRDRPRPFGDAHRTRAGRHADDHAAGAVRARELGALPLAFRRGQPRAVTQPHAVRRARAGGDHREDEQGERRRRPRRASPCRPTNRSDACRCSLDDLASPSPTGCRPPCCRARSRPGAAAGRARTTVLRRRARSRSRPTEVVSPTTLRVVPSVSTTVAVIVPVALPPGASFGGAMVNGTGSRCCGCKHEGRDRRVRPAAGRAGPAEAHGETSVGRHGSRPRPTATSRRRAAPRPRSRGGCRRAARPMRA